MWSVTCFSRYFAGTFSLICILSQLLIRICVLHLVKMFKLGPLIPTNRLICFIILLHSMILTCADEYYLSFFSPCTISDFCTSFMTFMATESLFWSYYSKMWWWKVVALCINKVLFMSYQSEKSLTDVNVICTVLWPKTARSSAPVIDKRAPSVTEHSSRV